MRATRGEGNEAVTPLIGTLLVLAITLVTGVLVLLTMRGFGHPDAEGQQNAGAQASSPRAGQFVVTLTMVGTALQGHYSAADIVVTLDDQPCPTISALQDANDNALWDVGESLLYTQDCQPLPAALVSGSQHLLTVSVKGTPILLDSPVRVR